MKPRRIQRKRTKGWRLPARDAAESRRVCVEAYRAGLEAALTGGPLGLTGPTFRAQAASLGQLRGHDLACWCPLPARGEPDHCHAAVLLDLANR